MEIYYNPYPDPATREQEALVCIIKTADALTELKKQIGATTTVTGENHRLMAHVIVRKGSVSLYFQNMLTYASNNEKQKLIFLMQVFASGRVLEESELMDDDNWIVRDLGVSAPILAHAVKKDAISLTIPTSPGWDVDFIHFEGRSDCLINIWGQSDLTEICKHYLSLLKASDERFASQFNATYCAGALNAAPEGHLWDRCGFFRDMKKAKSNGYTIDNILIKNVGNTEKHGALLELRCRLEEWRIFFVCVDGIKDTLLIGGFYKKGGSKQEQDREINQAVKRINLHA
jgi:hypothetical protein